MLNWTFNPRSHGCNKRIFDRWKISTGHFLDTEPLNIFALFSRNFEWLDV